MPDLLIRNLPDDMKRDIELKAKESGRSLSEQAKRLLAQALEAEKPKKGFATMVREAYSDCLITDEEHDELWGEIERERKSNFGRPLPPDLFEE